MLRTLKTYTTDLRIGMYVSGLDRPWLDTPFLTQGFLIESPDEIAKLREYCEYVQVDRFKSRYGTGKAKDRSYHKRTETVDAPNANSRPRLNTQRIFADRAITKYTDTGAWEEEHPLANHALNTLITDINEIFGEVSNGGNINVIKLKKSVGPIIDSIARNPDACLWIARLKKHDSYTYQHSLGAAIWSVSLGRHLGLPRHDLRSLAMGSMLMDIGKLRVNPSLLQSKKELSTKEVAELAGHVNHGLDILQESGFVNQDVVDIVAHHHERHDGSGYPSGLSNSEIPPFARIAAIVDTYDAITANREYADPVSPTEAIKLLYKTRDIDFQAELVEEFIQAIGIYPAGTLVELSSGEVAVVVAEYRARRLRPKVMVLLDAEKNRLPDSRMLDLSEQQDSEDGKPLTIVKGLEPEAYGIDISTIKL